MLIRLHATAHGVYSVSRPARHCNVDVRMVAPEKATEIN